jgi:hypothetical protein
MGPQAAAHTFSIEASSMKILVASLFALSLLGATAAQADDLVGVGVHVGPVGVGAGVGGDRDYHDRDYRDHYYHDGYYHDGYRHSGYNDRHGRYCSSWYWSHHNHYCRHYGWRDR